MTHPAFRWGAWLLGVALCATLVARAAVVTDITAFLPGPATREQALLAEQLRDGVAARVILIGVEAASAERAPAAASRSAQLAAALRADPQFAFVANGDPAMFVTERDRLFNARYSLSAQVGPQRFTVDGLRTAADELEALLRSSAAPLIKPFAARDPTAELLAIAATLKPARSPVNVHGVWFDPGGRTALLVATTRAPGFDVDAQAQAVAAIRTAFDQAESKVSAESKQALMLHLTGPGVFAVQSRQAIQHDAQRLTLIATVAVGLLLLLVLRSPRFLLWAALPTATGALAGLAAVSVMFGSIHGITLGFGLTLIGEAVDYALYVQVQRRPGQNTFLWRALWLAVLTSSAGFVAMMLSGFLGLMQLGLMSMVGIAVAAAVARFCLPDVLRPLDAARLVNFALLERCALHARRLRIAVVLLAAASVLMLIARGDSIWNDELAAISPLARGSGEMDARLRQSSGLGDLRFVLAVEGETIDQALSRAEGLHTPLNELQVRGAISGFDSPAKLVPSEAIQQARRSALPDESTLRARLTEALNSSALRVEAFEPFIADVQRARELIITPDYYSGTALGQRLAAQLVERTRAGSTGAAALITLSDVSDAAAVKAGVKDAPGVAFIDLTEVQTLIADYRVRAAWAAALGGALIVLILAVQLRNLRATARISAAVAVSIAITAALLVLIEGPLTLFHLVALLLAAGVGTNYALFLGMPRARSIRESHAEPAPAELPVVLSVTLAGGTTLIAFTTLAASTTPVLHMIGITVAIGASVALIVSMAFAPATAAAA
ncbi:MAG: MMPL family transporter [Burkholderiaceae bacterium]|nr:MMPL family transporter [Burkholderiaceae bacterium]